MNKVFVALLSGIAIGILIAPDKGSRTRARLVDGFNGVADTISDIKEQLTPEVAQVADRPLLSSSAGGQMMSPSLADREAAITDLI